MDLPENSDGKDKLWNRAWTTDEMRESRNDWSLAADAGLLEHLEQFSTNLTERVRKTQEKLNCLTNDLNETIVTIDNVTNASLALANTQFIESRVYDDDVETKPLPSEPEAWINKEELGKEDPIACASDSIKLGLSIMDEKFQRVEVVASDSEDEGEMLAPSVILKAKNPYENRPLPYVIGSKKWQDSTKVGLESSSSDSEPPENEQDSTHENKSANNRRDSFSRRSISSSSTELSDRNERSSRVKQYSDVSSRTDKTEARSQDTLNSGSEIATPTVGQPRENSMNNSAPNFAEELAQRLGNFVPSNRSVTDAREPDQPSINRSKDDLFASNDEDVFGDKSENLFSDDGNSFYDQVSNSLWKNKPLRAPKSNIIPPSLDVPPPINAQASEPRSQFDDIYGDADSEGSDDIFATKSYVKNTSSGPNEERENKSLNADKGKNLINIATSTPETNDTGGLFGDENDDDGVDDLFRSRSSLVSRSRITDGSPEAIRNNSRAKPPGLSITQADILSSNLGSRLFQRRVQRKDSSDSESSDRNGTTAHSSGPIINDNNQDSATLNLPRSEPSSIISGNNGNMNRPQAAVVEDSASSGVSIPANSTDYTFPSLGVDFEPQVQSTRLKSDEVYRERLVSDSLFVSNVGQRNNILDSYPEENIDSDDVFGPPPLPKSKSDVTSVDDLFSNISSGSRSDKSSDLLATTEPQWSQKSTAGQSRGLFDEDANIFGSGDAPDVDIFGQDFASTLPPKDSKSPGLKIDRNEKSADLFSTETTQREDLSVPRDISKSSTRKHDSIFDDSEDDDDDDSDVDDNLFSTNFLKSGRNSFAMPKFSDDEIFAKASKSDTSLRETKKESMDETTRVDGAKKSVITINEKRDNGKAKVENAVSSYLTGGGLFDNLDDDDDDSLFDNKKTKLLKEKSIGTKVKHTTVKTDESMMTMMDESKIRSSSTKFEDLLKDQSLKKSSETQGETSQADEEISFTDGASISKSRSSSETISESTKREPPKTLSIRLPVPSLADDSAQAPPRRAVSGKIQNLMGKMGNLKILSPTDTPPLWKKTDDKSDDGDDEAVDMKDSEDGSAISVPSTKTPPVVPSNVDDTTVVPEISNEPNSLLVKSENSETAVSFDVPAQVETLAVSASKSRARIQAKRRPQSRHARQTALRKSGIDFDTVDTSATEAIDSDRSENTSCGMSEKVGILGTEPIDSPKTLSISDRLAISDADIEKSSTDKPTETSSSLAPDDRSDMSFGKGSSMSINKHALLSPSTDEEDLFDVPPDLPEDPPKEDTLFDRAPILSPIDALLTSKHSRGRNPKKWQNRNEFATPDSAIDTDKNFKSVDNNKCYTEKSVDTRSDDGAVSESEPTDPLRDNSRDPLKDPSHLFAFVTKTPSPEKGQNFPFKDDDSLFSRVGVARKFAEEAKAKEPGLDLFADDTNDNFFSSNLAKSTKNKNKTSRLLFDGSLDTDEDGATCLFGSGSRVKAESTEDTVAIESHENRTCLFTDDTEDDLFIDALDKKLSPQFEKSSHEDTTDCLFPATRKLLKDTKLEDIFGDRSSGEEDIFATKKIIRSGNIGAAGSIFSVDKDVDDDNDDNDIFGKKESSSNFKIESIDNRGTAKKATTRDLKKTAEKIVEDPLSMLQND